jgi:hypothetical protein
MGYAVIFGLMGLCVSGPALACLGTQFESNAITPKAPMDVPDGAVVLQITLITEQDYDRLSAGAPAEARILRGPLRGRRVQLMPERWSSCDRAGRRTGFVTGMLKSGGGKRPILVPITRRNAAP